jgi:hypothetical protein
MHFENTKTILMDGTFKYSPTNYKQLYTLVGYVKGIYVPMIYVLMYKKNEESYVKLCNFLKERIPFFEPETIIVDFEQAPRKAFKSSYPDSEFYGCCFHFTQIIWRKIQELRLVVIYNSDFSFKLNIRMLLSLCFVREDKVRHYFDLLKTKLNHERERNKYVKIIKFFEKNYINVSDENLRFWNAYNRVLAFLPRTTNALEGFHRAINKLFSRANPDLGYFGEKLHEEHLLSRKKIIDAYYSKTSVSSIVFKKPNERELYESASNFDSLEPLEYLHQLSIVFIYPFK